MVKQKKKKKKKDVLASLVLSPQTQLEIVPVSCQKYPAVLRFPKLKGHLKQ